MKLENGMNCDTRRYTGKQHYVVELWSNGKTWHESYLAESDTEALRVAARLHCDQCPDLLIDVIGIER